jgi:hypothetical protein
VTIEDLEDRLKLYKVYKDHSKELSLIFGKNILSTKSAQKREIRFIPDISITPGNLHILIHDILNRIPIVETKTIEPRVKIKSTITLEEVMERIHKKVESLSSFSFSEFARTKKNTLKKKKFLL